MPAKLEGPGRVDLYLPLRGAELVLCALGAVDGSRAAGGSLLPRVDARSAGWREGALRGDLLPYRLQRGAPALRVRVVLGPLTGEEAAEQVGQVEGALELPEGCLLLATPAILTGGWDEESQRRLTLPAGRYRVLLHPQLPGPDGAECLRAAEAAAGEAPEPLGAYWRRTRPGEEAPDFLALRLGQAPHEDPEREEEWEAFQETDRFGALLDDADGLGLDLVDLVVRLEPDPAAPATTLPDDGWLRGTQAPLKPEKCPRGLRSAALG